MKIIFDPLVWKWVFHLHFVSNTVQLMMPIIQDFDLLWGLEFLLFGLVELGIQYLKHLCLKFHLNHFKFILKKEKKKRKEEKRNTMSPRNLSCHHFPKNKRKRINISFHFIFNWYFCCITCHSPKYFWGCISRWKSFDI